MTNVLSVLQKQANNHPVITGSALLQIIIWRQHILKLVGKLVARLSGRDARTKKPAHDDTSEATNLNFRPRKQPLYLRLFRSTLYLIVLALIKYFQRGMSDQSWPVRARQVVFLYLLQVQENAAPLLLVYVAAVRYLYSRFDNFPKFLWIMPYPAFILSIFFNTALTIIHHERPEVIDSKGALRGFLLDTIGTPRSASDLSPPLSNSQFLRHSLLCIKRTVEASVLAAVFVRPFVSGRFGLKDLLNSFRTGLSLCAGTLGAFAAGQVTHPSYWVSQALRVWVCAAATLFSRLDGKGTGGPAIGVQANSAILLVRLLADIIINKIDPIDPISDSEDSSDYSTGNGDTKTGKGKGKRKDPFACSREVRGAWVPPHVAYIWLLVGLWNSDARKCDNMLLRVLRRLI